MLGRIRSLVHIQSDEAIDFAGAHRFLSSTFAKEMKKTSISIILTAIACFIALKVALTGLGMLDPFGGSISPKKYGEFIKSTVNFSALSSGLGLVALAFYWNSIIREKNKILKLIVSGILTIPYTVTCFYSIKRYISFPETATIISAPSEHSIELQTMAQSSGASALIVLFCLTIFASLIANKSSEPVTGDNA
jgi:hypothetical protein